MIFEKNYSADGSSLGDGWFIARRWVVHASHGWFMLRMGAWLDDLLWRDDFGKFELVEKNCGELYKVEMARNVEVENE